MTGALKKKAQELVAAGWAIHPNGMCITPMQCMVHGVERAYEIFWRIKDGKKGVNRG